MVHSLSAQEASAASALIRHLVCTRVHGRHQTKPLVVAPTVHVHLDRGGQRRDGGWRRHLAHAGGSHFWWSEDGLVRMPTSPPTVSF